MDKVTLEKVDQIIERTGLSYKEAKEALEANNGDILETLIYIESKQGNTEKLEDKYETIEELKKWLTNIIKKGNVSRIKIKKDEKVLVDVPINAGVAAGIIAIILPSILAVGVITAIATNLTIEITKVDGSVEVVNKLVKKTAKDVKDKTLNFADCVREKLSKMKNSVVSEEENICSQVVDDTVYSYTVNFEEDCECEKEDTDSQEKSEKDNEVIK